MPSREELTSERLDECWLCLYDLGQQDGRKVSMADRGVLMEARRIVNRFQLYAGKKEKAPDVSAPEAQAEE